MSNWRYIPEIKANVNLDDIPEQLIGHPALKRYGLINELEMSKASVRENPERMQRHLNTLMALL